MMDAAERDLFAASLGRATGAHTGSALDAALDELGWADALAADPAAAVSLLFEHQGRATATSSALSRVILASLGLDVASGLVLPALGRTDPPGELAGDRLTVRGLALAGPRRLDIGAEVAAGADAGGAADPGAAAAGDGTGPSGGSAGGASAGGRSPGSGGSAGGGSGGGVPAGGGSGGGGQSRSAVVVARAGAGAVVVAMVATGELELRAVAGLDPALGLVEVVGEGLQVTAAPEPAPAGWTDAVAAGQRALAHELIGVARTMLGLAREHALDRVQFGRPIGAFQAVRHRLAEALVAIDAADAAADDAWDDGSPGAAARAKAVAGRSARTTARHCQQVLAGIGFTTEHPLHRSVRRALVLDQLLGAASTLTRQLGEELLASRRLPAPVPL
jgi:hypothetical protein